MQIYFQIFDFKISLRITPRPTQKLKIIRMTYKYVLRERKRVLSFLECLGPVVHPSGQLYREF